MSDERGVRTRRAAVCVLLMMVCATFATRAATAAPAPEDSALAEKIEKMLWTALTRGDEAAGAAAQSEMKKMFEARGLPTIAEVGDEAAYEFVLLAFYQQPAEFRERVLVEAQQAAAKGEIPADALVFLQVRIRIERAKKTPPTNPELRDTILRMAESDQEVRKREGFDLARMEAVDRQNEAPLRDIIDKYGVPTISMVGTEAASDFVLMVQHQPTEFRRRILPEVKANVDVGEADAENYALVYDRFERNEGREQRYGTQLQCNAKGELVEAPIADEASVNQRRAELGMVRVALYERLVQQGQPNACAGGR
jgi:hypothetical protein